VWRAGNENSPNHSLATTSASIHLKRVTSFSPQLQSVFRQIMGLVFSAAAACPDLWDRRSGRALFSQPPAQLQHSHEFASLLPLFCSDNRQRVQLLCFCCTLASRLALPVNTREGSRSLQRAIARIMQRCLCVFARRLWKKMKVEVRRW
jgi:hypothetical protein